MSDLFDRLLPLLKAVPPQDLNVTLTSISQALSGRGQEIGETIKRLKTIFSDINAHTDDLQETLRGLASFSTTYSEALPAIIDGGQPAGHRQHAGGAPGRPVRAHRDPGCCGRRHDGFPPAPTATI